MNLNLHAILPRSRANGPGVRTAIWFQGCHLDCPGCFNPGTHCSEPRTLIHVNALAAQIIADQHEMEGITISGGEPMEQAEGLFELLGLIRTETELSVLLFSGHTLREITDMPLGPQILEQVDVLIDGRYEAGLRLARGLRGSSNQRIRLLTDRYSLEDIQRTPAAEVHIRADGTVAVSGISPP